MRLDITRSKGSAWTAIYLLYTGNRRLRGKVREVRRSVVMSIGFDPRAGSGPENYQRGAIFGRVWFDRPFRFRTWQSRHWWKLDGRRHLKPT